MEKYKIDINSFFIISIFSISIFLWSFNPLISAVIYTIKDILGLKPSDINYVNIRNIDGIQFRFLYLVLLIPIIYFTLFKKKKYNFNILTGYFCFFLFIFLINYKLIIISPRLIFSNTLFFLTIIITAYYWKYLKNIDYLIGIFFFCFAISLITTGEIVTPVFLENTGNWTDKCGGITVNFINLFKTEPLLAVDFETFSKLDYENYKRVWGREALFEDMRADADMLRTHKAVIAEALFKENSHLSIISPSIILYLIYRLFNSNKNIIILSLITIFFIIFYIKSTSIFFLGIILSFLIIFIFNMRQFNKKLIITYFILISLLSWNFLSDIACQKRYVPAANYIIANVPAVKYIAKIFSTKIMSFKNSFSQSSDYKKDVVLKTDIKEKEILSLQPNLSASVLLRSIEIAVKSIQERPLGWGINNYNQASFYYENGLHAYKSYKNHYWITQQNLNVNDGSSTLIKMIVELGLFSIFPLLIIGLYVFSNKIPLGEKLFFFSLIFTQLIRGVGYFNSGFLIVLVFISLSYFEKEIIYFSKKNKIK